MNEFLQIWAHGGPSVAPDLDPARTIAGAAVRSAQAAIEAGPYLLCGAAVSGLLRGVVGGDAVRRGLGRPTLGGLARAWALGFVLPLGGLGALPVARRLLAMGVPRGTVLAFLISAAALGPLSIVLGLSLVGPRPIAACLGASLAWSLAAGLLVGRNQTGIPDPRERPDDAAPATPAARLARVVATMAGELSGPTLRDVMLAAAGAGALGAFLPSGWLERAASPPHAAAGLIAAAVGSLSCETPLETMRQAGVLLRDGYTHGVAFALLGFGSGNLAMLAWLRRRLGLGTGPIAGVAAIGLGAFALAGWGFDRNGHAGSMFHTHAFDELGRPILAGDRAVQVAWEARDLVAKTGRSHLPALSAIAAIGLAGLVARHPRIRGAFARLVECVERPSVSRPPRVWERPLPPRCIAWLAIVAAIPAPVTLLLTYYPPPRVILEEMVPVHTEVQYAVRLGNAQEALVWVDRWEGLLQRIGPAVYLRRGGLDREMRGSLDELIDLIAALRGFLANGRMEEARTLLAPVTGAQEECRRAFEDP